MRWLTWRLVWHWVGCAALLALTACASPPARPLNDSTGAVVPDRIELLGQTFNAHWYIPQRLANALVVLQPGFSRSCAHLRTTSLQLMAGGPAAALMVLCLDAPMAGGNLALADALAEALAAAAVDAPHASPPLQPPGGFVLPPLIIAAGHSAGGAFAVRMAARLLQRVPSPLAGVLLFDPVAVPGYAADLQQVFEAGRRPVLALLAPPHACNAQGSGAAALRLLAQSAKAAGQAAILGVQLPQGATHADVEGDDSDWLARAACGAPTPHRVAQIRELAVAWALSMALGLPATAASGFDGLPIE